MVSRVPMRRIARVLALALAFAAGGCSQDRSGTTIRFWTIGREGEVVAQLLPEFERAHPGVRVEVQHIPLTAAHD